MPELFVDIDDLARHARNNDATTGIFRVLRELGDALHRRGARFVRHPAGATGFIEVDWPELIAALERKHARLRPPARALPAAPPAAPATLPPPPPAPAPPRVSLPRRLVQKLLRRYLRWLSPPVSETVATTLGGVKQMLKGLRRMPAALIEARRQPPPPPPPPPPRAAGSGTVARRPSPLAAIAPGDVLLAPGAPWNDPDFATRIARLRAEGGRFAFLVHDLIPIRRPQWTAHAFNRQFRDWFDASIVQADIVLAISKATARDIVGHCANNHLPVTPPIVVPMGTGFTDPPAAPRRADLPAPGSYVLMVSSIETRKNQILAFRVWQALVEQMPEGRVPLLVLAGRPAGQAADFLAQIENSDGLGGHVRHIADASDADLAELYRGCRFTLYPSLYEGWGLPVTESLHFGRPCLAADRTSLPEAGGTLARYFDPDDLAAATAAIRAAIEDEAGMAALAARIAAEFRPASWADMAAAVMAACMAGEAAGQRCRPA